MKKYETPKMNVAMFEEENIVTQASGAKGKAFEVTAPNTNTTVSGGSGN